MTSWLKCIIVSTFCLCLPNNVLTQTFEVEWNYDHILSNLIPQAESGDPHAQTYLAGIYANDLGPVLDYKEAIKWYRKAAEQGYIPAQTNLGLMYEKGNGTPQNFSKAVEWYRKAAEQGGSNAQYNLGLMYANGLGVLQDYILAHMWFNISAANGADNADAIHNRNVTSRNMTGPDIVKAQDMARACMNSRYQDFDY